MIARDECLAQIDAVIKTAFGHISCSIPTFGRDF